MIKHKQSPAKQNSITVVFGYSLFIGMLVSYLLTTGAVFTSILFNPNARHDNVIAMLVAFTIAAVLPALVSYGIGDRATHNKNKAAHRYNGVLFAVAAYWILYLLMGIGFSSIPFIQNLEFPASLMITNITPVVLVIGIMAAIAATYVRHQKKKTSVLEHRPYQVVLLAAIGIYFVYPFIAQAQSGSNLVYGLFAVIIPLIFVAISYKVLAKFHATRLARVSDAVIAMSLGWAAITVAFSLSSLFPMHYLAVTISSYAVGVVVWVLYLYLRTRKA